MSGLITIIAQIYQFNPMEGTESLSHNVRVATCIDDLFPKYSYTIHNREKAIAFANEIHKNQNTDNIVWVDA